MRWLAWVLVAGCGAGGPGEVVLDAGAGTQADGAAGDAAEDGGAWSGTVATAKSTVHALAASGTAVAWVERDGERSRLMRIGDGGAPAELSQADYPTPAWGSQAWLFMDQGAIVWTWPGQGTIRRIAGGAEAVIAEPEGLSGLAVGPEHVYWTEHGAGKVWRAPLSGGASENIAAVEYPTGVVAGPDGLFVIDRLDARMIRYELDGSDPTTWATWPGDNTMRLSGGEGHLVWSDNSNGKLMAMPRAGGEPVVVAEGAATMDGDVAVGEGVVVVAPGEWDFDRTVRVWPLPGAGTREGTDEPTVVGHPGEGCGARVTVAGGAVLWSRCDGRIEAHGL